MSSAERPEDSNVARPVGNLITDQLGRLEIAMLSRVLTTTLADALPPAMVMVERRRSLADRLAGRPGVAIGITIRAADQELTYRAPDVGQVETWISHIVRGVTLSRAHVTPSAWLDALAAALNRAAAEDDRTRQSLRNTLLG